MNKPDESDQTTDLPKVSLDSLDSSLSIPPQGPEVTLDAAPTTDPGNSANPPHHEPTISRIGAEPNEKEEEDSFDFLLPSPTTGSLGKLGHYDVLQVLGRGGCGVVFRAFDESLQRVVAIKVMARQIAMLPSARKRFLREARTSGAVRHKNVVQVYEVAEHPLPYLAMEYIPGETLQQKIKRAGKLGVSEVLQIGREIADGLAAAHAQDLIHRDIKPGNVLIEEGPAQRVKITDFGLARAADDASVSHSGMILGTPMFMAPEQALGHDLDQRADLFSLGSVLYQMVTGKAPFQAPSTLAVMARVAEDSPTPIQEIVPETPIWLCEIIAKLHAKNPDDRYQTARELADVLAQCKTQNQAQAQTFSRIVEGKPQPSRRWKWPVALAVLLPVAALALTEITGATHLFRKQSKPANSGSDPGQMVAKQSSPVVDPGPAVAKQDPPIVAIDPPIEKKQAPPVQEKPVEKKTEVLPANLDDNPLRKANAGDWVDFKVTWTGKPEGTIRILVDEKAERANLRYVTLSGDPILQGRTIIDLSRPLDPAQLFRLAPRNRKKVESGSDKVKLIGKEFDAVWTRTNFKGSQNGVEFEENFRSWFAAEAPVCGLLKAELSFQATNQGGKSQPTRITFEIAGYGHRVLPIEARNFAAKANYKAAAEQYVQVFSSYPMDDAEIAFEYACVLMLLGDLPAYDRVCKEMFQRIGQQGIRPYHVARSFTLTPDYNHRIDPAARPAEAELQQNLFTFWSLTERGALAYRAGRNDDAAKLFEQSLKADNRPGRMVLNWLWLALVEYRRDKPSEAQAWLDKSAKWIEQHPTSSTQASEITGDHLHNWLEAQILYREAIRAKKLAAILRGEERPAVNADRLVFARFAFDSKKFDLAAKLWTEALETDPKLGDDRQSLPRYNAACAAVMAAAGQSDHEAIPDDAAKAKLRQQALAWLKLEFNFWQKTLKSQPGNAHSILRSWTRDSDLASIRAADQLAKLPADEQKAFAQFWIDVRIQGSGANGDAARAIMLALDHKRRGEKEPARQAYKQAVTAMKPAGNNPLILDLMHDAAREFGLNDPDTEALLTAAAGPAPNVGKDANGYLARGHWYASRCLLRKAVEDFESAKQLQPKTFFDMGLGILLGYLGQTQRYRDHCQSMLERHGDSNSIYTADQTIKTCCLVGPEPVGDPDRIAKLGKVLASTNYTLAEEWNDHKWFNLARAMHALRMGRFKDAAKTCQDNRVLLKTQMAHPALPAAMNAIEAIALQQAGDSEGSRRMLAEARKVIDEKFVFEPGDSWIGPQWYDWLVALQLFREAESLRGKQ